MLATTTLTGHDRSFSPDGVVVARTDLKGRITCANQCFLRISRLTEEQALAASLTEQSSAASEIARNVEQASAGAREVAQNVSDVRQAMAEIEQSAQEVLGATQDLESQPDHLGAELGSFLSELKNVV